MLTKADDFPELKAEPIPHGTDWISRSSWPTATHPTAKFLVALVSIRT
jgi:hypothetical protein